MIRSQVGARAALLLALAAGLAFLSSCGESELPLKRVERGEAEVTGRGVLVLVVDGLRYDHTTFAGYDRDTTPFLARFAESALSFDDAWTPVASQIGAHVALLTGCDPMLAQPPRAIAAKRRTEEPGTADAGLDARLIPLELQLVARPFLARGWRTAAFVDHPDIAELRGFDVGFREFIAFGGDPRHADETIGVTGVGLRFLRWVNALELDEDWFAYVHMHDLERQWQEGVDPALAQLVGVATKDWKERPELAFAPPIGAFEPMLDAVPPSRGDVAWPATLGAYELRYDRAVRALDMALQRLIGHVDEFGRDDDVTIVVVGSFGTEFGEHGLYLCGGLAEEEDLHVPLLVRPSRAVREALGIEGGKRIDALVSSLDVAPTLVDLFGLPAMPHRHGFSLRPLIARAHDQGWEGPRQRLFARAAFGGGRALVQEDWIYVLGASPTAALGEGGLGRLVPRRGGNPEAFSDPGSAAGAERLLARWESLVLEDRRLLHFRGGEADTSVQEELRSLQVRPVDVPDHRARQSSESDVPGQRDGRRDAEAAPRGAGVGGGVEGGR